MNEPRRVVLFLSVLAAAFAYACSDDSTTGGKGDQEDAGNDAGALDSASPGFGSDGSTTATVDSGDAESTDSGDQGTDTDAGGSTDAGADATALTVTLGPLDASGLTGDLFQYGHFITSSANNVGHVVLPAATESVLSLGGSDVTTFDVSADGTKILYASDATLKGRFDLRVAASDGSGAAVVAALKNAGRTVSLARFSGDGNVAWVSDDVTTGAKDVYFGPLSGATAPVLISPPRNGAGVATKLNADQIVFSRDGRYIAITGDFNTDNAFQLWIYDTKAASNPLTEIVSLADVGTPSGPGGVTNPVQWDAEGRVYFTASIDTDASSGSYKLYMASATLPKQVVPGTTTMPNQLEQVGSFGVSADGNTIAASITDATGAYPYALYTLPAGGGARTALINASYTYGNAATANPDFAKPLFFSPDGTKLAFVADYQGANADYELFVVSTQANSTPVRLFKVTPGTSRDAKWIAWAPNGSRLAFTSDVGTSATGNAALYMTNDLVTPDQTLTPLVATPSGGGLVSAAPRWSN